MEPSRCRFTPESGHSLRTGRADKRPRHFAMSRPGSAPGFGRSFRGRTAAVSDAHWLHHCLMPRVWRTSGKCVKPRVFHVLHFSTSLRCT